MNIETKFNLNQKVWVISNSNYGEYRTDGCSICNRSGTVIINGEVLTCPKCQGRSVVPKWNIECCGTVVKIEVVRTAEKFAKEGGWDNANSYQLDRIGSGRIWPEDHLFVIKADAEAECVIRNSSVTLCDGATQ